MKRPLLLLLGVVLAGAGCASTQPAPSEAPSVTQNTHGDLVVAGWRVPFECTDLAERIAASRARLLDGAGGMFASDRTSDERRLRSLEARADELGCLAPGSPFLE